MWHPFGKKKGNGTEIAKTQETSNTIDGLANRLQKEGRIGELEQELEKVDQSSLTATESESWWQLYGIAAFRAGRDADATKRFEEGHKRFPGNAPLRFSLGQQYVRSKQIAKAFELFATCNFPELPRNHVLAQARYAYLWNRYADGRSMLAPFLEGYKKLKILDDHFLYVRGLPFFGTWWSYLAAFSILGKL